MDFSVMFFASLATGSPRSHYRLLLDAARLADGEGFTGIWTPERHFDEFGGIFPNPALSSAALAVATERIQLRAGSVISPLHDALLLAEDWAVVDNLSGGRVAVSFGSGWNPDDFVLNAAAYVPRREIMWEQIALIRHLWSGGTIQRPNGVGDVVEVGLVPRPVQAELPLWITTGGTSETFIRAGAVGAHLLTHIITQDLDALAERIELYRSARANAGHEPDAGCVTLMLHTFVGKDHEEVRALAAPPLRSYLRSGLQLDMKAARARDKGAGQSDADVLEELLSVRLERYFDGLALLGDIDACVRLVSDLEAIGVDEAACLIDFGIDADSVLRSLIRLCEVKRRCTARASETTRST
ncbi:MAG: MupA/Atu3671 family FMN-dependent luciferase-like monooxygenase [Egibacteraceae bacterium]